METKTIITQNKFSFLAEHLFKSYTNGTVGIVYDDELGKDELTKLLNLNKNRCICSFFADACEDTFDDNVRYIVGIGSIKIVSLCFKLAKNKKLSYLPNQLNIGYYTTYCVSNCCDIADIVVDKIIYNTNDLDFREPNWLRTGYLTLMSTLTNLIDASLNKSSAIWQNWAKTNRVIDEIISTLLDKNEDISALSKIPFLLENVAFLIEQKSYQNDIIGSILETNDNFRLIIDTNGDLEFFINYCILCCFLLFTKPKVCAIILPLDTNCVLENDSRFDDFSTFSADENYSIKTKHITREILHLITREYMGITGGLANINVDNVFQLIISAYNYIPSSFIKKIIQSGFINTITN